MSEIQATVKAGFHWWRSQSRSRNQKHRAYDPVTPVFRRLPSTYDLVKTRLSELEAEAEELNQSQMVGMFIVIGLSFWLGFRLWQSGFH